MTEEQQRYLAERQDDVLFIEGMLNLAIISSGYAERAALLDDLLVRAHAAARNLGIALDSVNLPKGGDA